MQKIVECIKEQRIIPVMILESVRDSEWVCEALYSAGMRVIEITFRTEAAAQSIEIAKKRFPELLVGAGTVIWMEQAKKAAQAGASFLVSPGLDIEIVQWAREHELLAIPGVITPTEILSAIHQGLSVMKFFPAESYGGAKTLEALKGPFPQVKFMPTGGINPQNVATYLQLSNVIAVGGTWMVKPDLIQKHDRDSIYQLASDSMQIVKNARS